MPNCFQSHRRNPRGGTMHGSQKSPRISVSFDPEAMKAINAIARAKQWPVARVVRFLCDAGLKDDQMSIPNWTSIHTAQRDVSEAWADHVDASSHADVTAYYDGVQPILSQDDENGTEYGEPEDLSLLGIRVTDGGLPVYYSRAEVAEKFPELMEAIE